MKLRRLVMRRVLSTLTILAATVLLSGSTLMAKDTELGSEEYGIEGGKDECLLVSANCPQSVDSIQMRIERLNREIAKGLDVYTRDELNTLERKLNEAVKDLEGISSGG